MFENTDSSDDNDESLSKQALPATDDNNEPVDLNKVPATGEEYLRQVRFQASQLPNFQAATKENTSLSASATTEKKHAWHKLFTSTAGVVSNITTKHIVPIDWQNEQCLEFSNVRNDYLPMRDRFRLTANKSRSVKLRNTNDYWKFCFGNDIPFQSSLSVLENETKTDESLPTIRKMMNLTQPQLYTLLQHENDWLKTCGYSLYLALYTYATLVAIEKPVSEDVTYTMRQTCSVWKQLRTKTLETTDADHPIDESLIKSCDLFICIIGRYFGQFDLADQND